MTSIYYGMVTEVDDWVGKILQRLDELGLADNTLVIFTSDHGEMLGDHGMHSKNIFYEGSVHVPLLMRLPGVIPAGTVVQTPSFASRSLRHHPRLLRPSEARLRRQKSASLHRRQGNGPGRVVVSEWNSKTVPGFMMFDGRWKFLCGRTADAPVAGCPV